MGLDGGRGVGVFGLLMGSGLLAGLGPVRPTAADGILGAIAFGDSAPTTLSGAFPVDLAAIPAGGCLVITAGDGDEVWEFALLVAGALPVGVCPAPAYAIAANSGIHRTDTLPENTGGVNSPLRGSDGEATAVGPSTHTERKNTRTPSGAPLG
jgi:hypothetical protein